MKPLWLECANIAGGSLRMGDCALVDSWRRIARRHRVQRRTGGHRSVGLVLPSLSATLGFKMSTACMPTGGTTSFAPGWNLGNP